MAKTGTKDTARHINNLTTVLVAIGFVAVGIFLLLLSSREYSSTDIWIPSLLGQTGGLLVATGLIALVWDLVGKRAFTAEVLSRAQLRSDLVDSGLERVTGRYLTDVEWDDLFTASRSLDVVVAYASTWRSDSQGRIENLLARRNGKLRVFLPDPDDAETMSVLAQRFGTSSAALEGKVREAIKDFRAFASKGDVEIYVRPGDAVFSCYQFDHKSVITLYSHSKERRWSVPTFVVADGFLREFIGSDIEAIKNQSKRI